MQIRLKWYKGKIQRVTKSRGQIRPYTESDGWSREIKTTANQKEQKWKKKLKHILKQQIRKGSPGSPEQTNELPL